MEEEVEAEFFDDNTINPRFQSILHPKVDSRNLHLPAGREENFLI